MSNTRVLLLLPFAGMLLAACTPPGGNSSGGGAGSTSASPEGAQRWVDVSQFLARATYVAEREGRVTLNNLWTPADAAGNEINYVEWKKTNPDYRWQGTTYTTLLSQYRERRKQCERDSQVTYRQRYPGGPFGSGPTDNPDFPICEPTLANLTLEFDEDGNPIDCLRVLINSQSPSSLPGPRYGYWCGAGHPPFGVGSSLAPQPLDAVDFCCMLHDAGVWGREGSDSVGRNNETERGMSMCVYMATEFPAGAITRLPDVENSRQFWYRCTGWASHGNQANSAPAPIVRR